MEQMSEFEITLTELYKAKTLQAEVDDKVARLTEQVATIMSQSARKSSQYGGLRYTLIQAERTKINEVGLKKALGARAFNKLTTAKVDQKKVKDAIVQGTLDPVVLAQHSENVLNRPAIRITAVVEDDA